jgi:hypothetical protein
MERFAAKVQAAFSGASRNVSSKDVGGKTFKDCLPIDHLIQNPML